MESIDLSISIVIVLMSVLLYFISYAAEKYITRKWCLLYFVPSIAVIAATAFSGFDIYMLPVYSGALLLLAGYIKDSGRIRRTVCGFSALLALATVPLCTYAEGYRKYDYVRDFKDGIAYMERHYVLSEHKNIDFDELYNEFLPKFQEVNRTQDETENLQVWTEFCARFNDGHVGYYHPYDDSKITEVMDKVLGNDYGFAPMTLSGGKTVAVNVEKDSEAYRSGIRNGTVIKGWNGVSPEKISDENLKYFSCTDKETRNFFRTLICGGTGGDSITVDFDDENNIEKSVVLKSTGPYYSGRLKDTLNAVAGGIETGHMMWKDIDDKTSAFRIKFMQADSKAMHSGEFTKLEKNIAEKIIEMKQQGKEHIIIDIRDNSGGNAKMTESLVSVFAPASEEIYYCSDAKWDNKTAMYEKDSEGRFTVNNENYITGKGLWDGKVTILVNSASASASDHFVYVMKKLENVKVIGFTKTNGSAQGVGEMKFPNEYILQFSGSLFLDEEGEVFIDAGTDNVNKNDIDMIVPFDEEAVKTIFDNGEDYLLKKALQ